MKNLLTFIFLVSTLSAFAQISAIYLYNDKVRVHKELSGKLFLVGKDCGLLDKEGEALASWTTRVHEKAKIESCTCNDKGVCKKEITHSLPELVRENHFKDLSTDGPNSWNGSLVVSKVLPNLRYSSDGEMNFWLGSPLCRERAANEEPSPGDIITIRGKIHFEMHAFVHLSDNLSFSKKDHLKKSPFVLQNPDQIFNFFRVNKDCRRMVGVENDCDVFANYYTCTSMEKYLKENPVRDTQAKNLLEQLNELECKISESVISGQNSEIKNLIFASLSVIHTLAFDTIMEEKNDPHDLVIWQSLYHRSQSLAAQLEVL